MDKNIILQQHIYDRLGLKSTHLWENGDEIIPSTDRLGLKTTHPLTDWGWNQPIHWQTGWNQNIHWTPGWTSAQTSPLLAKPVTRRMTAFISSDSSAGARIQSLHRPLATQLDRNIKYQQVCRNATEQRMFPNQADNHIPFTTQKS